MENAPFKGQVTANAKLDFFRMGMLLQGKRVSDPDYTLFSGLNILGIIVTNVEVAGNPSIVYKLNIIKDLVELPVPLAGKNPRLGGVLLPSYNAERKRNQN